MQGRAEEICVMTVLYDIMTAQICMREKRWKQLKSGGEGVWDGEDGFFHLQLIQTTILRSAGVNLQSANVPSHESDGF